MTRRVYFREIYLYIVCIIAIIIFIVGLIMVYNGTVDYVRPATYMTKSSIVTMYSTEQYPDLSADEIDRLAEEEIGVSIQNAKDMAFKDLLRGVLLVIIAIPLFIFHWKKAQAMWNINLEAKDID
ncbi:MAG: hypothetical protein WC549_08350 [Actinomycetota bacterium]